MSRLYWAIRRAWRRFRGNPYPQLTPQMITREAARILREMEYRDKHGV
jgi:hypothetical protein